jgi:hypothetical protein
MAALAVGATVGGSMVLGGGVAAAQDEAFIIKDFFCRANVSRTIVVTTDDKSQVVDTPSGNRILTCHFTGGRPVAETLVVEGIYCNTFLGFTADSRLVYTTNGQATLTCIVKPSS